MACVGRNGITEDGAKYIGDGVAASHMLFVLDVCMTSEPIPLDGNKLGVAGTKAISAGIEGGKSLRKLMMERCGVGDEGAKCVAQALSQVPTLQLLSLSPALRLLTFANRRKRDRRRRRQVHSERSRKGPAWLQTASLYSRDASPVAENNVGNKGAQCVAEAARSNKFIHTINLCSISD